MENKETDDPIVLYLIIRESLNMSTGKIAAQVGHAVQKICDEIDFFNREVEDLYYDWIWHHQNAKVVLRADDKEWEKIKEEYKDRMVLVIDAVRTEIKAGSETCIGLCPMRKSERSKTLKRLQLL